MTVRKTRGSNLKAGFSGGNRLIRGAAGIAKAAIGRNKVDGIVMMRRWALCGDCPHAVKVAGIVQTCGLCGCILRAKIRLAGEQCPADKW